MSVVPMQLKASAMRCHSEECCGMRACNMSLVECNMSLVEYISLVECIASLVVSLCCAVCKAWSSGQGRDPKTWSTWCGQGVCQVLSGAICAGVTRLRTRLDGVKFAMSSASSCCVCGVALFPFYLALATLHPLPLRHLVPKSSSKIHVDPTTVISHRVAHFQVESATNAMNALSGRTFDGRKVAVNYLKEDNFDAGIW